MLLAHSSEVHTIPLIDIKLTERYGGIVALPHDCTMCLSEDHEVIELAQHSAVVAALDDIAVGLMSGRLGP